jgi:hypothetical protein
MMNMGVITGGWGVGDKLGPVEDLMVFHMECPLFFRIS